LKEFTKWYIKSEIRLKKELRKTFDEFDVDKSGTIDGKELRKLMKELGTEVMEEDVEATLVEAHITGPSDQISFEEFQSWYTQSMVRLRMLALPTSNYCFIVLHNTGCETAREEQAVLRCFPAFNSMDWSFYILYGRGSRDHWKRSWYSHSSNGSHHSRRWDQCSRFTK
jgi:hypothetical protein